MKKLIYFVSLLLLLSACESNEAKMFNKGDANIYFSESKIGVTVGNLLSIPVTLANLSGGAPVTVGFTITDSTAVEGVDYILRSPRTCTFEKGHGVAYIVIEAIEKEADSIARRVLTVDLDPVEGFRKNDRTQITVELRNYSNHPLKHLLGDASFTGVDLVRGNGVFEFPVNIYPDDENEMTLYLSGFTGGAYGGILPDMELNVDTILHQVSILPKTFVNRKLGGVSGDVELVQGAVKGNNVEYKGGEPIRWTYDKEGNLFLEDWFGASWTSGSENEKLLYLYYGFYNGKYSTGILRKK